MSKEENAEKNQGIGEKVTIRSGKNNKTEQQRQERQQREYKEN